MLAGRIRHSGPARPPAVQRGPSRPAGAAGPGAGARTVSCTARMPTSPRARPAAARPGTCRPRWNGTRF